MSPQRTPGRKPTPAQLKALQDMAAGRSPTTHLRSMSAFGGFTATWASLFRNGWRDAGGFITDAGRAAIAKATGSAA